METTDTNVTINPTEQETQNAEQENNVPSQDDLIAQLAETKALLQKAEAERDAANRAKDKANKEAAERKREALANMTADEQAKAAAEEERKRIEEELAETKRQLNHINAVAAYKKVSDEKTVNQLIEAVSAADHASIATIIEAEVQRAVKAAQAEWMKARPAVNAGSGEYSSMTKEQIMAIKDEAEQRKAIAANLELFEN